MCNGSAHANAHELQGLRSRRVIRTLFRLRPWLHSPQPNMTGDLGGDVEVQLGSINLAE